MHFMAAQTTLCASLVQLFLGLFPSILWFLLLLEHTFQKFTFSNLILLVCVCVCAHVHVPMRTYHLVDPVNLVNSFSCSNSLQIFLCTDP